MGRRIAKPVLGDIFEELGVKQAAMISHKDLHDVEYSGIELPDLKRSNIDVVMNRCYPMGRLTEAKELAGQVLLLASNASGYIKGQIIYQDGGKTDGQ